LKYRLWQALIAIVLRVFQVGVLNDCSLRESPNRIFYNFGE